MTVGVEVNGRLFLGLVNLLILGIVLVWKFSGAIKRYVSSRSRTLNDRRSNVLASLSQKEGANQNYRVLLEKFDEQVKGILEEAGRKGEREGEEVIRQAEKAADVIVEKAVLRADREIMKKNREFYERMVDESIVHAGDVLRKKLELDEHVSLCRRFLERLKAEKHLKEVKI